MREGAARLAGGLALLAAIWIGVYWWWPAEPPVTFDTTQGDESPPTDGTRPAPIEPPMQADPKPVVHRPEPEPPVPVNDDPPVRVIPPQYVEHTVAKNETLASISKRYYGTEKHAEAIVRFNGFMDPRRLREGRVIKIPKDPTNIQGKPVEPSGEVPSAPTGDREYVVQKGDSLSKIAALMYGDAKLAEFIYEANKDRMDDQDSLKLGQKLRIPPKPTQ